MAACEVNHDSVDRPSLRTVWMKMMKGDNPLDTYYGTGPRRRPVDQTSLIFLSIFGVTYFVVYGLSILLIGWSVTLPGIYSTDKRALNHGRFLACWLYAMTLVNYALVVIYGRTKDRLRKRKITGLLPLNNLTPNVAYCGDCQRNTPPRAKHCVICRHCILKRDHHCFFSGTCIGFHNQRFFAVFCFYATLGSYYSAYVTFKYIVQFHTAVSSWYSFIIPIPVAQCILGYVSFTSLWLLLYNYVSFMTGVACSWFFCQQMLFIFMGTTSYEFTKRTWVYRTTVREHLQSVFGSYWALNFLIPLVWVKNKGNGQQWGLPKFA